MICPKCGFDNKVGKKFCTECGEKLSLKCPTCNSEIEAGEKFCGECGCYLKKPAESPAIDFSCPYASIFYGKHVRKGVKIYPTNVLDILPTVLYLIGLPVAQDMDGTIIKDAIDPQHLASSPPKSIKTYETKRYEYSRVKLRSKQSPDAGEIERLRSLGYMN